MFYIRIKGHTFKNEIKEMILQYFHEEDIKLLEAIKTTYTSKDYLITSAMEKKDGYYNLYSMVERNGQKISKDEFQVYISEYNNKKMKN